MSKESVPPYNTPPTLSPATGEAIEHAPVTWADVARAVLECASVNGRSAAEAVLANLGVTSARDLKPEQYAQAVADFAAAASQPRPPGR
jgi:hypothetical protein